MLEISNEFYYCLFFFYFKFRNSQHRFSKELLSSLSSSLLDGTVFEIVNNLSELQQITERNLISERNRIQNEYSSKQK